MSDTPRMALPLIEAAQAQKHVTHNEALVVLDALAHLFLLDRDLADPPASPAEGDAWLVVEETARACYGRMFHSALEGAQVVAMINRMIARDPDPELAEAVHVRRGMALPDTVFLPYVQSLIETLG